MEQDPELIWPDYVNHMYMMTTTATTVGYGDFSSGEQIGLKVYMCITFFFGLASFSIVVNNIFAYE
jgi:hypothetical protein